MNALSLRLGRPGDDFGPVTPMREPAERWLRWDLRTLPPAHAVRRKQPAAETAVMLANGWAGLAALLSAEGRDVVALIQDNARYRCATTDVECTSLLPVAVLTRNPTQYAAQDGRSGSASRVIAETASLHRAPRLTGAQRALLGHGYDTQFTRADGQSRAEWMYLELSNGDLVACVGYARYPYRSAPSKDVANA